MQKRKKQKAFALILCTAVLLLLSTMAITFTRVAVLQRGASVSYTDNVTADIHGYGSIDLAIANLVEGFKNNIYYRDYLCFTEDAPTQFGSIDIADDETAAGLNIKNLQEVFANNVNEPSYSTNEVFQGHNISNFMNDATHMYTLKVFDTTSQININSDLASLPQILSNLAEAIEMKLFGPVRADGSNSAPYIFDVDVTEIGNIIVNNRPKDNVGYRSKDSIIGLTDGNKSISEKDFEAIKDFITIFPLRSEMDNSVFFKQITFKTIGNENELEKDSVAPININTAAWPVLYALFKNISMNKNGNKIEIDQGDAIRLANAVCVHRQQDIFPDFSTFMKIVNQQGAKLFNSSSKNKIKLLDANFNPDVTLKKQNANRLRFQNPNRSDLLYHTINFCFFSGGHFEITSLVQNFSPTLGMVVAQKYYTNAQIFEVDQYDSQEDFEGARQEGNVDKKITQNSFTAPNNLQLDDIERALLKSSDISGFFDPIQFDAKTGFTGLDNAVDPTDASGNYLFRADFNGSVEPNKATENLTTTNINRELPPNPAVFELKKQSNGLSKINLAADGFVLKKDDENSLLSFDSFPSSDIANLEENGNLPALLNGNSDNVVNNEGKISDNKGSIMFWFKINDAWGNDEDNNAQEFRTIFFSNSTFKQDGNDINEHFQIGVQREIEMRVQQSKTSTDDNLRKLEVKVTNKFVIQKFVDGKAQELSPTDKDALADQLGFGTFPANPGEFITFTKQLTIDPETDGGGVHTQEFYHLAVRWHNGTQMNGFSDGNDAIKVTGQFYNNAGGLFQRGADSELSDFQTSESQTNSPSFIQDILQDVLNDNFTPLDGNLQDDEVKPEKPDPPIDPENPPTPEEVEKAKEEKEKKEKEKAEKAEKEKKERQEAGSNLTLQNKIFIGPPDPSFGTIPEITIDDIRISENIDWMSDSTFLPSRYELNQDPNSNFFAKFDVEINTPNGGHILFVKPEILQVDNGTNVESTLNNVLGLNNKKLPNLTEFLKDTVEELSIEVKENKRGRKKREIKMHLKDKDGEDLIDTTFKVKFNGDHQKFTATQGKTLEESLQDYLKFINEPLNVGSLISDFNVLIPLQQKPGEPVSVTFTFNRQDRNPIFQSPLLDKVTFAYFTNLRLLEYRFIGR
ncbi:hypothetical protein [Candidatus Uabimicrobium sp. HlEnr_7]|uniref:hypothetical protein n=1 Tax=Candidatus Uabimicrobium helgolandensis TaxID=3095367 RepID=UPI00355786F5